MEHSLLDAEQNAEVVTLDVIEKYQKFVNPTQVALLKVGGFDHIEACAQGVTLTDLDGNSYIDCLGGYGVFSVGHRHPKVVQAVKDVSEQAAGGFEREARRDHAGRSALLIYFQFGRGSCRSRAEDRPHGVGPNRFRVHARRVPRQDNGSAFGDGPRSLPQTV